MHAVGLILHLHMINHSRRIAQLNWGPLITALEHAAPFDSLVSGFGKRSPRLRGKCRLSVFRRGVVFAAQNNGEQMRKTITLKAPRTKKGRSWNNSVPCLLPYVAERVLSIVGENIRLQNLKYHHFRSVALPPLRPRHLLLRRKEYLTRNGINGATRKRGC